MKQITLTRGVARKVLEVVDAGLVSGLGVAEPGKMCVEAAVCYALGLPHGDNPKCVGSNVRSFKISLNDCKWSSNEARTKGMRKLAIAQLGSNEIDQQKFLEIVGFKCITQVLPVILLNSIKEDSENRLVEKIVPQLREIVEELRSCKDFAQAKIVSRKVRDIYWNNSAYASASAYAYAYASASASASAYASAYASASASASAYANKNPSFNDKILNMIAQAGLEALIELKSPGCKWLNLCK